MPSAGASRAIVGVDPSPGGLDAARATVRRGRWRSHPSRNPSKDLPTTTASAIPSSRPFPGQSPHR